MSINIEQAVEAAAKALYETNPHEIGHGAWETVPAFAQFEYREVVTPIVDAAVNYIAAQAWAQGAESVFDDMWRDDRGEPVKNPYVEEEA